MLDPSGFLLGHETQPPHPGGGWAPSPPPASAAPGLNTSTVHSPSTITSGIPTHYPSKQETHRALSSNDLHHLASFLERVTSGPDDASSTSSAFTSPATNLSTGTSSPPLSNSVTASPLFGTVALSDSFEPLFPPSAHSNVLASLSVETKKAETGDFPFDLDPASFGRSYELLAFPAFESGAGSAPANGPADPIAFDNLLESPLGLSESGGSTDPSPLSDFLASPLFSVSGCESAVPSATMSELPLPSPLDGHSPFATSGVSAAATAAESNLAWFPPHPSSASLLFDSIVATASMPMSSAGERVATVLRELPPAPSHPPHPTPMLASLGSSFSPRVPDVPLPAPPSRRTSSVTITSTPAASTMPAPPAPPKRAPTGFRQVELLPLDAPIQSRNSVLPSATSRKRKTAGAERALAKRGRTATPAIEEPAPHSSPALADAGAEDLPADIVAAVERKRLQNTLSARKSRARKHARLQELETENEALRARIAELEARLAQPQV
ncbi:hypothetical protein B0A53_00892 [Rhodotorula sp. CCFEE 5036]|nr:hypothetical protein B0A53_00892 [Rhodotorula sp. CCFEE 5036]